VKEKRFRERPPRSPLEKDDPVKDRLLKEQVLRHFWAQRCFVQPELDVRFRGGISPDPKMITDVDIFVLRPHPDLYFERILADCRTLKGQSPIGRVLWLRGVMDFAGARTGLVLLGANARIEQDHKLAANRIGIRLLRDEEFPAYDKAIVYPEGSERVAISLRDIQAFKDLARRFPKLERLLTYLYRDAWAEATFGELFRHLIGQMRTVASELDPEKVDHVALVCDAAAIFAVGLAECAGEVFHQYLQPSQKEILSESLKLLVWGGHEQYHFYQSLRKRALEAQSGGRKTEASPLDLPEWDQLIQLVRSLLDRPGAAFDVPWLLRRLAIDTMRRSEPLRYVRRSDLVALKFSMLTVMYLTKASGLPREFSKQLEDVLVKVQARLALGAGTGPREVDAPKEGQGYQPRAGSMPDGTAESSGPGPTQTVFPDVLESRTGPRPEG